MPVFRCFQTQFRKNPPKQCGNQIISRSPAPFYTMTSSLRNSLHRRNHKERSQLVHRTKLGILEKHKDYVKRAQDYHSKQNRLHRLKQKAAERNKDEFYFSMIRERTKACFGQNYTAVFVPDRFRRMVCISKAEATLCFPQILSRFSKRRMRIMFAQCELLVSKCVYCSPISVLSL